MTESNQSVQDIVELNDFVAQDNGVFAARGQAAAFEYSDGEAAEQALNQIMDECSDLSSASAELEKHITDWPTEYHLSSTRANLLRALNLDNATRVLELGCGCGSISRYLGEQPHLQIDSVEGSPTRAALAVKRCRDLPNVRFLTANFNQLEIPQAHYDVVLFVGVLEYAGRFSEKGSDQEAVLDLLKLANNALKPGGVTAVAIENRTGLKYAMGAKEDHYALPYVGIENYPNSSGIRTYDHAQWQALVEQSPFSQLKTLLPFPDYKIPHLLIDEALPADAKTQAVEALAMVRSRDYCSPELQYTIGGYEPRLWQGLVESGTLTQLSNSFLLLLGDDADVLRETAPKQAITEFRNPKFEYLEPPKKPSGPGPLAQIKKLTQKLEAMERHSRELEKIRDASNQQLNALEQSYVVRSRKAIARIMQRLSGRS